MLAQFVRLFDQSVVPCPIPHYCAPLQATAFRVKSVADSLRQSGEAKHTCFWNCILYGIELFSQIGICFNFRLQGPHSPLREHPRGSACKRWKAYRHSLQLCAHDDLSHAAFPNMIPLIYLRCVQKGFALIRATSKFLQCLFIMMILNATLAQRTIFCHQ